MTHITDNHDALLDYLYEEGDPTERLTIAKHLQECAACAVAVLEFQNVRGMLSDWTPPTADLGFRIVQDSGPATHHEKLTAPRSRALFQAAAALLLFVSGMAVSQLHVEYRDGAVTVRTRSAAPAAPAASIRNASITLPPQSPSVDANEIERDLRARLEAQNTSAADTERLLQRVRTMIDQSEQRQQRALALRLSQVAREVDTQHQADLLQIQQDFGKQQDATMEYLVKTSGGAK
jgi:anti-sigma factor RsiW